MAARLTKNTVAEVPPGFFSRASLEGWRRALGPSSFEARAARCKLHNRVCDARAPQDDDPRFMLAETFTISQDDGSGFVPAPSALNDLLTRRRGLRAAVT